MRTMSYDPRVLGQYVGEIVDDLREFDLADEGGNEHFRTLLTELRTARPLRGQLWSMFYRRSF